MALNSALEAGRGAMEAREGGRRDRGADKPPELREED